MMLAGWHSRRMLDRCGASIAAERAREAYRRRSRVTGWEHSRSDPERRWRRIGNMAHRQGATMSFHPLTVADQVGRPATHSAYNPTERHLRGQDGCQGTDSGQSRAGRSGPGRGAIDQWCLRPHVADTSFDDPRGRSSDEGNGFVMMALGALAIPAPGSIAHGIGGPR
jgi:hypothetical protein